MGSVFSNLKDDGHAVYVGIPVWFWMLVSDSTHTEGQC